MHYNSLNITNGFHGAGMFLRSW